jgi:hypothetical protein
MRLGEYSMTVLTDRAYCNAIGPGLRGPTLKTGQNPDTNNNKWAAMQVRALYTPTIMLKLLD